MASDKLNSFYKLRGLFKSATSRTDEWVTSQYNISNEVMLNIQPTQSLFENQNIVDDNQLNFDDMEFVILEEDNPGNNSCNELTSSDIEYIDEVHTVDGRRKKKIIHNDK
ncbi:hypothetical protein QTP88_023550 [Uroleucon formosanum]